MIWSTGKAFRIGSDKKHYVISRCYAVYRNYRTHSGISQPAGDAQWAGSLTLGGHGLSVGGGTMRRFKQSSQSFLAAS